MPADVLDGKAIAAEIIASLVPRIEALTAKGAAPRLVVVRANDDKGSASYAKATRTWCEEHGIDFRLEDLGPDADQARIEEVIRRHNEDAATSALMLHMPVPDGVDSGRLMATIHPLKDAEGMHPVNLARLLYDPDPIPGPCTALGAVKLAQTACPDLSGKRAIVLGRSQIVGRPAALLLISAHATVQVTHTRTADVSALCREADLVIAATGAASIRWKRYRKALKAWKDGTGEKPAPCDLSYYVTAEMVKPGAAVIDVGVNRIPERLDEEGEPLRDPESGKIKLATRGDVDFEGVKEVAGYITGAKGGSGAMTNAMLLRNAVTAAETLAERT
jgi:methylenetetrahydrofolate dehydrogenase (NADP+)/methenyltetrahydrofolate cyclohydrolase